MPKDNKVSTLLALAFSSFILILSMGSAAARGGGNSHFQT